jgi:predicted dehydrogenase
MATAEHSIGVGIVGCGLIGKRRATEAAAHAKTHVVVTCDASAEISAAVASEFGARSTTSWRDVVDDDNVGIVVVATPNGMLAEISIAALEAGKHVLLEKPMGRNVDEALAITAAAEKAGKLVKVGFNHRYHPAIRRAHDEFAAGRIGTVINMRVRYGHGGRPGYEKEWRGNPTLAGGGELTDQGVHALDLINWFAGTPERLVAMTQTAIWPIAPLEDNGFALLHYASGAIASLHTSWTQWKNLFSMEIFGDRGDLIVEGLGRSYGIETLTIHERAMLGGAPQTIVEPYDVPDDSWKLEWAAFLDAIVEGKPYDGNPADGIAVMAMLRDLYRSTRDGAIVCFESA